MLSASTLNALNHAEFRAAQRRSVLAVLRPVPEPRRTDRDVSRRRAEHLQSQDRSAIALYVLRACHAGFVERLHVSGSNPRRVAIYFDDKPEQRFVLVIERRGVVAFAPSEAVNKRPHVGAAGETACRTSASTALDVVAQAVPPACLDLFQLLTVAASDWAWGFAQMERNVVSSSQERVTNLRKHILTAVALLVLPFAAVRAAEVPQVGQSAPEFSLPSQEGGNVSLKDFHGKWVVLYFYPKDMTQGCTIEAHNFQQDLPKYEQKQRRDRRRQRGLDRQPQRVLRQREPDVQVALRHGQEDGGPVRVAGRRGVASRNTFLIDPAGKVAKVWTGVSPAKHSEEVLAALAETKK